MADLTRPWPGPSALGVVFVHQEAKQRWCKYGGHSFATMNRMQVCCDNPACREAQRVAQRKRDRKTYRTRKAAK